MPVPVPVAVAVARRGRLGAAPRASSDALASSDTRDRYYTASDWAADTHYFVLQMHFTRRGGAADVATRS